MAKRTQKFISTDNVGSHEDLDKLFFDNAKYFTVVQARPGGIHNVEGPYDREEVPTYEAALALAKEKYAANKRGCLIYAVADVYGGENMSRHVDTFPPVTLPFKWAMDGKPAPKKKVSPFSPQPRPFGRK